MRTDPRRIFAFDFETTSPKPESTRVVQYAALLDGANLFSGYCNPGVPIHPDAQAVHGISNQMVENEESDVIAVGRMADYVVRNAESIYLAGHNIITFDVPIMFRIGDVSDPPVIPTIDTMIAAIRLYPEAPNHKLADLVEYLKLGGETAHDAVGDIKMVLKLVEHFKQKLGFTTEGLAEWLSTPMVQKYCTFKKHKGREWGRGVGKVPYNYAKFIVENFDSMTADLALTLKHHYSLNFLGKIV